MTVLSSLPDPVSDTSPLLPSDKHQPHHEVPPRVGLLALSAVPALWASAIVAVTALYEISPGITSAFLNLGTYLIALASLLSLKLYTSLRSSSPSLPSPTPSTSPSSPLETFKFYALPALELGFYLFMGSYTQMKGLEHCPGARAAFILQMSTAMVPVIETVRGRLRDPVVLAAAAASVVGVLMYTNTGNAAFSEGIKWNVWDSWVLASAAFYAWHVIRLGAITQKKKELSPTTLITFMSTFQVVFSGALFLNDVLSTQGNGNLSVLSQLGAIPASSYAQLAFLLFWLGGIVTALGNSLQAFGQKSVSPTVASVLYALQPVWATLFVVAAHQSKWEFHWNEVIGGALVIASSIIAGR